VRIRFTAVLLIVSLVAPNFVLAQTSSKSRQTTSRSKKKSAAKTQGKASSKTKTAARKPKQRKKVLTAAQQAKLKRLQKAFVTSSELKPMAKQLLEARSKTAYDAVEKFAAKHADQDAGGLAYLLLGYARITDSKPDYDRAISDLKNAKPHARDLADYVDYYLAHAYLAKSEPKNVVVALDKFVSRYPDSLLRRDAALIQANALISLKAYEEAADVLDSVREPVRADVELALGKARRGLRQDDKALYSFRKVYFEFPVSGEADEAGSAIREIVGSGPLGSWEQRKLRVDTLTKARQWGQAVIEYKQLIAESSSPQLQIALANAYSKLNRASDAKQVLLSMDVSQADTDLKARRLYLLAEMARNENDDATQQGYIDQLTSSAPQSSWTQEALTSAGNKFLLRRDFENAIKFYGQGWQAFPRSAKAPTLHWKCAWLNYRLNRFNEARQLMEEQVQQFPGSNETANAIYWLGRIAENEQRADVARAYYAKLTQRFGNYYYGLLGRERLAALGDGEVSDVAVLQHVSKSTITAPAEEEGGADSIRFQKAKLLANAALYELAVKELQSAASDPANADWANAEMIRMYLEAGKPFQALRRAKQVVPSSFAIDVNTLPKTFAEGLFPRPYWDDLQRSATSNGLDPYLVASLIRQESEFNPAAISHANAYGLMQLLPEVGKQTAKQIKFKHYSTADLLDPSANLKLGAKYFKSMIDEYNGQVEYALAAYNAGTNRVAEWRAAGTYKDIPEFVESIPFTETREYVQAIMRNRAMYKKIYEGQTTKLAEAKSTD
jgi:soluble lytic murein transglycosylase